MRWDVRFELIQEALLFFFRIKTFVHTEFTILPFLSTHADDVDDVAIPNSKAHILLDQAFKAQMAAYMRDSELLRNQIKFK